MHMVLLTCITLKAVWVGEVVEFSLVSSDVLPTLVNLLLQTVHLARALKLLEQTLVAYEQEEHAEDDCSDGILIQYPFAQPRMLLDVRLDVGKFHQSACFAKSQTKVQKKSHICKYCVTFFHKTAIFALNRQVSLWDL